MNSESVDKFPPDKPATEGILIAAPYVHIQRAILEAAGIPQGPVNYRIEAGRVIIESPKEVR